MPETKLTPLTEQVQISGILENQSRRSDDSAWIEVVQYMDNIYADLVKYQVELESKNSQLEDAQSFIQSVMSSISDILIVCDINGSIQQVNEALTEIIGVDSDQLVGQTFTCLFSEEHMTMISEFPEHIRSGSLIDCDVDLIDVEKNLVPMAVNCSARYDHENRLSGLVITGRPLGELRKAYHELNKAHEDLKTTQLQLIQSEKMVSLGRLIAGVAHELNNPISFLFANMHALKDYQVRFMKYLNAIHNNISVSERDALRSELKIDHLIDDINSLVEGSIEGAERVNDIVQNLRRFSTPQERKSESFDLMKVIHRATSWVLNATTIKPQVNNNCPTAFEITNNEGYVHQILINLIQNAVDAIADADIPVLTIDLNSDANYVYICIQDNGNGIKDQDLIKLFDPFFTTKPVGSGTGLGLYICYGLAREQCQGDLTAQNMEAGGAKFTLTLPREGVTQ